MLIDFVSGWQKEPCPDNLHIRCFDFLWDYLGYLYKEWALDSWQGHKVWYKWTDSKPKNAFIKKSTIFTESLQNSSWVTFLTEFSCDQVKIKDFLIKAYFWFSARFIVPHLLFHYLELESIGPILRSLKLWHTIKEYRRSVYDTHQNCANHKKIMDEW